MMAAPNTSLVVPSLPRRSSQSDKLENKLHRMYSEALENFRALRPQKSVASLEQKLKLPMINLIVRQSVILCEDYIYSRLRRAEAPITPINDVIPGSKADRLTGLRNPSDVSMELQRLGRIMENKYPELYKNISRQILMPLRSEAAVRKALVHIGDYMFKNSIITWGRIVGLFAVTAALAKECVEYGHSQHIRLIITVFSELIERHASSWIYRQGGWVRIITVFRTSTETHGLWALTIIGLFFGFMITWSIQT